MTLNLRVAARYLKALEKSPQELKRDLQAGIEDFEDDVLNYYTQGIDLPETRAAFDTLHRLQGDLSNLSAEDRGALGVYGAVKYDLVFKVKNGYVRAAKLNNLWLMILQQFSMSSSLRKRVEKAAQFYSRGRVQRPRKFKELEAYEKYLTVYRQHQELLYDVLRNAEPHDSESEATHKIKAGPFTIINTGGFSDDVVREAVSVTETAARLMAQKGLSRACYGNVAITNTLHRSNVLAFYQIATDEVLVRANLKGKKYDTVQTLIHELAHRLHFKFLKSRERDMRQMYHRIMGKDSEVERSLIQDPALRPKPGEKLVSRGKTYEVERVDYKKVYLHVEGDPKAKASIPVIGWINLKGLNKDTPTAFVTRYAKKDFTENFAEMVAFYCLDKLPADQVEMLEAILK